MAEAAPKKARLSLSLKRRKEDATPRFALVSETEIERAASRLFACNVPEKVIQEKTGHRSLAGLRSYERTTTQQEQAVAKILESSGATTFSDECSKENRDPEVVDQKPTVPPSTSSNLFSGQLQNCVFNFYSK